MMGIIATRMLPAISTMISLYVVMKNMNLLDKKAGLVALYLSFTLPFAIWILMNLFQTMPKELEEAARIDGTSRLGAQPLCLGNVGDDAYGRQIREDLQAHGANVQGLVAMPGVQTSVDVALVRSDGQRATGFLAGDSGRWLDRALTAEGVDSRFLAVPGETRTCLALIDPQAGRLGEIREPGPSISAADQDRLLAQLPQLAASCSFSVVSGSLPVGVAPAYLAAVVGGPRGSAGLGRARGCLTGI